MGLDEKGLTLEEAFEKLEETIEKLEEEGITLEDSFKEYQKGMDLLKKCVETKESVEKNELD